MNAPEDLKKAIAEIADVTKASPAFPAWVKERLPPRGKPLSSESRRLLGQFLAEVQDPLNILSSRLAEGEYRFLSDFSTGPYWQLPHLAALRS